MSRLLFVCMGNICRSPTAEGVMAHLVRRAGLADAVSVQSAGTGGWHVGNPPDARSVAAAARRGVVLEGAARQVVPRDLADFDLLLCADAANVRDLQRLSRARARAHGLDACVKIRRLREFDPEAMALGDLDVPDPYYGGPDGFEQVLDVVTAACEGLLQHLRTRAGPPA